MKIKSQAQIDAAYKAGIPKAAGNYKNGIIGTTDWQEKAIKGESNYAAGVGKAVAEGTRAKKLAGVSNAEWQAAASSKGAERIGPGMLASADKRAKNYEPFRQSLEGLVLPDRTTDSNANIDNRLKLVVKTLEDTKKAQMGR